MPEPVVSLVGFAFGCIGFLATVRNGISLILNDYDNFKQFGEDLVPLLCEVSDLSNRIEIWSRFWRLHDGSPECLLSTYWGIQGGQRMWAFKISVDVACQRILDEFKSKYGKIVYSNEAHLRKDGTANNSAQLSSAASGERLERHIQHYKERFGGGARLSNSLLRGPLFRKHLDALASKVKRLEENAITEFTREWECDASEARKHAVDIGTHFVLSRLATTSVKASEALLELLSTIATLGVDYQVNLGYGIPTDRRANVLAERAGRGVFPYHLQVSRQSTESALKVTAEKTMPDKHDECFSNFEQGILHWTSPAQGDLLYMRPESRKGTFVVKGREGWTRNSRPLRSLFSVTKPEDFLQSLHGDFAKRDRIKLAYELAESAMVFLKTNWYSRLCSCTVQRACIDEAKEEYEYCLRMSDIRHLDPESGEMQSTRQWCEEELLNMHIQRLGILLVEITLGTAVIDVSYDPVTGKVELDLGRDSGLVSDQVQELSPRKVARRVERAAGEDFSLAVEYCLQHGIRPKEVGIDDLERFYNRVVAP